VFENSLKEKIKTLFPFAKVTMDMPSGDTPEQDTIFITVETCRTQVGDVSAKALVRGYMSVYANSEKLKFGFFNKQLATADIADTKNLFFYNIDTNAKYYGNLVERRCGFIYMFSAQHDPDKGSMTSLQFGD
jgi:hypothetical protein